MQPETKNFVTLMVIGGLIGLGKLLQSSEVLTMRLVFGRVVLGSGCSIIAGVVVLQIPDINPLALLGLGSALGIVGSSAIEAWLKTKLK